MKKITIILMGSLIIITALTGGCIKEIEEEPSEVTLYTYTAAETGLEKETQEHASLVWEKIKDSDEAKFVTSEKPCSAIVFIHPYTVGGFDLATAEWVVVVSSIRETAKAIIGSIFRLDYQTFDLKKAHKFDYPLGKELTLDDAITIMQEEMAKEREPYQTFLDREKVVLLGGNYVYSYPASDFGGTIIVNKYAGRAIFYATTVWDGVGRLIIPTEVEVTPLPSVSAEPREHWHSMVEKISLWQNGEEQVIDPLQNPKEYIQIGDLLIETLHKLNLQAVCVFAHETVEEEIKQRDEVVELIFKEPVDITISQLVQPDKARILENIKAVIFILQDNLGQGLQAHVLIGSEYQEGKIGYGCWAIQQEGSNELDRTWIDEINNILSGAS